MGWGDRDYSEAGKGGGRFRAAMRRVFGDGEDPFTWSLPLYTAWRIHVRIHLVFVILIIAELIWSIPRGDIGWPYMLIGMGTLLTLVLLHEYGHCIACRWVGGTADRIMLWPLGGLAYCDAPKNWRDDLITTVGGPAVNAVLLPVFAVPLWALAGRDAVLFNPFAPGQALGQFDSYWLVALWWLHYTNAALLAFNVLLPMYPMDGGRILYAILWRSSGHRRAMQIATTVGIVAAIALFVVAVVGNQGLLIGVAIFGGLTCWAERRRLQMTADDEVPGGYDFSRGYSGLPDENPADEEPEPSRADRRRREREEREQAEEDRILAKIAASGLDSLTARERRTLQHATDRRRRG